ncbi:MAG: redoxin domain-containing protein [Bacteroidota bacterium]
MVNTRKCGFLCALWLYLGMLTSCGGSSPKPPSSPELFIFLAPDCPASMYYIPELRKVHASYGHRLNMTGIVPGTAANAEECQNFKNQYPLPFEVFRDSTMHYVKRWGAEVTPEVVLVDGDGKILYRGAINDAQPELGIKRTVVQRHYLQETLLALEAQHPLPYTRVQAVGCFIASE